MMLPYGEIFWVGRLFRAVLPEAGRPFVSGYPEIPDAGFRFVMVRSHESYPEVVRFPVHCGSGDGAMFREPNHNHNHNHNQNREHADGPWARWMYGLASVSNGGRCGWFCHGGHVCLRGMTDAYPCIPFFRQGVFLSGSGPD